MNEYFVRSEKRNKITVILMFQVILFTISCSIALGQSELSEKHIIKILVDELDVKGEDGTIIETQRLYHYLVYVDTLSGYGGDERLYMRSEFVDNQLQTMPSEWFTMRDLWEIDLKYSKQDETKIDIIAPINDDNGNFRYTKWLFSMDNNVFDRIDEPLKIDDYQKDIRLLTREQEYWGIAHIEWKNQLIFQDSCHDNYKITFNSQKYEQSYDGSSDCMSLVDTTHIQSENLYRYEHTDISHKLNFTEGRWKSNGEYLFLLNEREEDIFMWKYYFVGKNLILESIKGQKITLEKVIV